MPGKLRTILAIAGSDPVGGAGIQADIRSGILMGTHVLTAVTAVTAQNSKGLIETGIVNKDLLKAQLEAIKEDVIPDAVKIGMVPSVECIKIISEFLQNLPLSPPVVIDPVLSFTADNSSFHSEELVAAYKEFLIPFCTVLTPNLGEISYFSDINPVIIKGGDSENNLIEDILIMGDQKFTVSHKRLKCSNLHGTGCCYSTLLAGFLALGFNLKEAFYKTSALMQEIIARSCDYTLGKSSYGPLNINNTYQYDYTI